ncbi:6051_t:CDS:1, partial [Dentiscutata heterogama]
MPSSSNSKYENTTSTPLEISQHFLNRFAKLSTEMCSSSYPTISSVYPMYNYLID